MADFRCKITDGTTTLDLYSGTDAYLLMGGLSMPPPTVKAEYVENTMFDGSRLASSSYGRRQIGLRIKIVGSSLSDLATNVRTIQKILNDARDRALSRQGTRYYLEVQFGDTANQSTLFDILRGDLELEDNWLSRAARVGFTIKDATINLICEPFGRRTNVDIAQATLENGQSTKDFCSGAYCSYDGVDTIAISNIQSGTPAGQNFVTGEAFTVKYVGILAANRDGVGSGTTITCNLKAVDGSGFPTGAALASDTLDLTEWDPATYVDPDQPNAFRFVWFTFDTPYALSDATEYCIEITSDGDGSHRMTVGGGNDALANGNVIYDSGGGWVDSAAYDWEFALAKDKGTNDANYQDITTGEGHGDVPAKMYWKLNPSSTNNNTKIWVAKRTGSRYNDSLWIEGESYSSWTKVHGETMNWEHNGSRFKESCSDGRYACFGCEHTSDDIDTEVVGYFTYTISTLPKGLFRVLARCKAWEDTAGDITYDEMGFGIGWAYGQHSDAPTVADGDFYYPSASNTWEILDLGTIRVPPVAQRSDIAPDNDLLLRLYIYAGDAISASGLVLWSCDWIFLLPVDEGSVIVDDLDSGEDLVIDSISDPPKVLILDGSGDIDEVPNRTGRPFPIGRENTRLYVIQDTDSALDTFASDVKYQPQQLII